MEQRTTSLRLSTQRPIPRDIAESLGKLPPQALDLEETVLGALLLEKNALIEIAGTLKPEHFYKEQHQEIYQAILDLFAEGSPVDMRSVVNKLRSNGKLELIGGAFTIAELTSKVSSAANIVYHSRVIIEMAIKRSLITIASTLHHDAYEDTIDVFDLYARVNLELQEVLDKAVSNRAEKSAKELSFNFIQDLQAKMTGKHGGLKTGFPKYDQLMDGLHKTDLIVIAARPAMGKGLALDEMLLSESGWIKMRDVKVGDKLAGSDGRFYPVTGVFPQGIKKTYKVQFDDGTTVICDDSHLWLTNTRADRKIKGMRKGTVKNILEIKKSLYKGVRKNHSIPFVKPIQLKSQPTKLHPYLLGVLIGDGGLTTKMVGLTNPEKDIIDRVRELLPKGYCLSVAYKKIQYRIKTNKNGSFYKFIPELENTHSYERFVPDEYINNSVQNRIELLRGLFDTDACISSHRSPWIEYTTTSYKLALQVCEIVRGLGGRCRINSSMGKYKNNGVLIITRRYYRLSIVFANGVLPISSKKHLKRYIAKRYSQKFITDVSYAGKKQTQCITIASPDNLFVTNGHTLTHNSLYALQIGKQVAEQNVPVGVFSLEMSGIQIVGRLNVAESGVFANKIQNGQLDNYEYQRVFEATGKISSLPIYIDDTGSLSIVELRARAIRMKMKYGIQLLIVDYLQLIKGVDHNVRGNRDQEIGIITRTLKAIAKELEIPVIALSQLSRDVEKRGGDKRPVLSDLREGGSIENDSDICIFLYRPEYYHIKTSDTGEDTHGLCEIIVAKHRAGGLDTIQQKFIGSQQRFAEWIGISQPINQSTYISQHVKSVLPSERTPEDLGKSDNPF